VPFLEAVLFFRAVAPRGAWLPNTMMKKDNVYYSGHLQKQTRDLLKHMLKQEDMLNRETSAKQVAVFSAAVVTCISKHFAKSAFRDRARSFFRKCFTFLRVFLAGC